MQSPHTTPSRFSRLHQKVRSGHLTSVFTLLAVLSLGILAGSLLTGRVSAGGQQTVDSSNARPLSIPDPKSLSNGFSQIVRSVGPAVVNINTESLPKASKGHKGQQPDADGGDDQDDQNNDMQNFLHRFFGGQGGEEAPDAGPTHALGSGFIVDTNGYIITNNHVVDKADHIYVKLSTDPDDDADPGRPATVVGVDKETDIAVIKIDPRGLTLPTIKLGNSDGAQVGDWVLAIGSPFGLNQTVSAGIVSAKNRSIDEAPDAGGVATNQFQKFIQTDAAINPGNSGGPLVDMAGEVVGMNTAIYTQSMGSEGVGFAMPSNTIATVYNMLISPQHKVTRGSIGITFQAAQSSAVSRMYNFTSGGVLVSGVVPDGPAAKAGLQPQDVILTVDSKPVKDGDELVAIVSAKAPGSTVRVGFLRDGKHQDATVGIVDRAKLYANLGVVTDNNSTPQESDAGENKLGIKVQSITPTLAAKLGVKGGVTVTSVRPGSFADEINLTKGVVITEINRHPVTGDTDYRSVVNNLKSGDDVVFVLRDPRSPSSGNAIVGGTLP